MRACFAWGAVGILSLGICSCASNPPAKTEGGAAAVREPSPVDPKSPPQIHLSGIDEGQLVNGPVRVSVNVENYPMEADWQGAVVVLDDLPGKKVFKSGESVDFADTLQPGPHALRAYLVRAWGESLRLPQAFTQLNFFFGKKSGKALLPAQAPSIVLNSPQGSYRGADAKKILLDFVVANTQISERKHRLRYTLNGEKRELTSWDAYYFQNLAPGTYTLKVEMTDASGKAVRGAFTSARSVFTVE